MSMKKNKDGCYINKSAMRFDEWKKGDLVFQCHFRYVNESGNKFGYPYIVTDINKEEKDCGESMKAKWPHLWGPWTPHAYPKDRDGSKYYWALLTSVGTDKNGNIKHVFVKVSDTMKDDVKQWQDERNFRGNLDYEWSKQHLIEARLKKDEEKALIAMNKNAQRKAISEWRYKLTNHIAWKSLIDIKRDPYTTWCDAANDIQNAMKKNGIAMCTSKGRQYLRMEQNGKDIKLSYCVKSDDWTKIIGPMPEHDLLKEEAETDTISQLLWKGCPYENIPKAQVDCELNGTDVDGEFRWYIETSINDGHGTDKQKYMLESEVTEDLLESGKMFQVLEYPKEQD